MLYLPNSIVLSSFCMRYVVEFLKFTSVFTLIITTALLVLYLAGEALV